MAQQTSDESVLGKIESLVHEEQRLDHKATCRITTRCVSTRFTLSSTSAGTCCDSGEHGVNSIRIPMAHPSGPRRLSAVRAIATDGITHGRVSR